MEIKTTPGPWGTQGKEVRRVGGDGRLVATFCNRVDASAAVQAFNDHRQMIGVLRAFLPEKSTDAELAKAFMIDVSIIAHSRAILAKVWPDCR